MVNEAVLPKTPSILGNWALLLAKAIDSYGLNSQQIFFDAGIDLHALKKPNTRVPAELMTSVWQQAVTQSQDPYIALRMARYFQPSAFSALGMGLSASRHVYESLHRAARYAQFISDSSHCIIKEDDSAAAFCVISRDSLKFPTRTYATESSFSCLFKVLQTMAGGALQAKEVHFQHGFLGPLKPYEKFFGCPVYFSSHCNKLEFDKEDIFEEQIFSNSTLTHSLDEWVEQHLADIKEGLITTRVQQYLLKHMAYGEIDLATVAKAMALSPRIVQRKLKHEGTSYSRLLDDCRYKLAIKLLSHVQPPLSEVAYILGFSDQSNFSRSFRRWTGSSPGHFREHHQ